MTGSLSARRRSLRGGVAVLLLLVFAFAAPRVLWAGEAPVTLFAAASTAPAVEAIIAAYTAAGGGEIRPVFAASSTLARQIMHGAPADLFLSANNAWMDAMSAGGLLRQETRVPLLGNHLVLVAPPKSALRIAIEPGFPLAAALGEGRIAMGDPAHVPAGIYAQEALQCLGVWDAVRPKAVYTGDVRGAVMLASRGEVAAAIVYASDAHGSESGVRLLGTVPQACHQPIRYPLGVIAGKARPAVAAFYRYLLGADAAAIWRAHGFEPLRHPGTGS